MPNKRWVKFMDLPKAMVLDGLRVRYKGNVLGYIRSGWGSGLWVTPKPQFEQVSPWFPPEGSLAEAAHYLEFEVRK